MGYVRSRSREIRVLHLSSLHRAVATTQYALSAMLVLVILQIVFTARYQLLVLTTVVGVSYLLATILMGLLAKRFLLWHRTNKNFIVLLYGLASASIAVNTLSTFSYLTIILSEQPAYVLQHTGFVSPYFVISLTTAAISNTYTISSILSFMLSWAATSLLIRQYYPKISHVKFWMILLIPLAYFLFQFQPLFLNLFSGLLASNPVLFSILYTLIFTASKPVGGIIFASVFLNMARSISHKRNIKNYLIMSALGFILLFVSNQAVVLASALYPPFGLAAVSFVGLSAYLILVGIYSSAVSVAHDSELRKLVRTKVKEEFDLLRNIGTKYWLRRLPQRCLKA
ncbi:MAG: hypothetical protein WB975_10705 [Nitrososphaeraceae archaeon]